MAEEIEEKVEDDGSMPILQHLEELRWRLIKSIIAIAVCSGVAFFFLDEIMAYITASAGKLYYMQPSEAFFTYMKVTIFCGFPSFFIRCGHSFCRH